MKKLIFVLATVVVFGTPLTSHSQSGEECAVGCINKCQPITTLPCFETCVQKCFKGCMDRPKKEPPEKKPKPAVVVAEAELCY